jgi:hypothetical protein
MKKRDEQTYIAQQLMFKDLRSQRPIALFLFCFFDAGNQTLTGKDLTENEADF